MTASTPILSLTGQSSKITCHQLALTTCTPVFIGSGEKIEQAFYIDDGKKIYIANEFQLIKNLSQQELESYGNLFYEVAESKLRKDFRGNQASLQKLFHIDSHRFTDLKKKGCFYEYEIDEPGFTGQITGKISLFQRTATGHYIPGSTIKGTFRQLLLRSLIKSLSQNDKEKVFNNLSSKKAAESVENDLLRRYTGEHNSSKSMLTDLFRVIHVSDSEIIPNENFFLVNIYSLNLQKYPDKKPATMKMQHVCLKPGVTVKFNVSLDWQVLNQFGANHVLTFNSIDEFIQLVTKEATTLESGYKQQVKSAGLNQGTDSGDEIDTIDNHFCPEGLTPNFYMGANTGFDRHTIWSAFNGFDVKEHIRQALPKLPKGKDRSRSDKYLPRTVRIMRIDDNDYLSLGWCHLKILE
jgi:CRISPR-associated protein Csm5